MLEFDVFEAKTSIFGPRQTDGDDRFRPILF
jgi:hypothetical protein